MKTLFILVIALSMSVITHAQMANATFTVRFNTITSYEDGGSNKCYEAGDEEYTLAYARFFDNVNGATSGTGCFTCTQNGTGCTYGSVTTMGTRTNTSNILTAQVDAFEDDIGDRCQFNTSWYNDDDCRYNGNVASIDYRVDSYPSNGTYRNWQFGNHNHRLTYSYTWRYSGSANQITPSCTQQVVNYAAGTIRSWSVYLTAGVTYNFNTCSSGTAHDSYLRLYAPDGYTITAQNDDNCGLLSSIDFTPTTSGTYYLEVSRFSRQALTTPGVLSYSIVTPTTSTNGGNVTACVGTNSPVLNGNNPVIGSGTWTASHPSVTFSNANNPGSTLSSNTPGTYTATWTINNGGCLGSSNLTASIQPASVAPSGISGTGSVCVGNAATLSVNGGSLSTGAQWEWFTGSCGGTPVGTGSSITVNPGTTQAYYVRASAGSSCPATACASGSVSLPSISGNLSIDGESATCVVQENGWVHFYNTSSGRLLCAINSNGQNLGSVSVTSYVQTAPFNVDACADPQPQFNTATLGRRWVITPQHQPTSAVSVRLYFHSNEYNALSPVANANANGNDNTVGYYDLSLSKYTNSVNTALVNSTPFDNCASGSTTLHGPAASGTANSIISGFDANGLYTEYSIGNFSEFWLHGSTINSPLPVTLTHFTAECTESTIDINWVTETEKNSAFYRVEKSSDGISWSLLQEVTAAGTTQMQQHYSVTDNRINAGSVYYRLRQVDTDGTEELYGPIAANCQLPTNEVAVYPNPSNGSFTLEIVSSTEIQSVTIGIYDLNGKLLLTKKSPVVQGVTTIHFNDSQLAKGTYIIKIPGEENYLFVPVKLVVQ